MKNHALLDIIRSMDKGKPFCLVLCLLTLISLASPLTVSAVIPSTNGPVSARGQKEELLCARIREKAGAGQDIRKLVKTGIQMGYGACGVIKCAISGGGNLRLAVTAAVEAGATKDVVSRCALDACIEASDRGSPRGTPSDTKGSDTASKRRSVLCMNISDKVKAGMEIRKIVHSYLSAGNDICDVALCARRGGGDLNQIMAGATDAGHTRDDIAHCAVEACARDIASALNNISEPGLCYIVPEEPQIIALPPGGVRGAVQYISPSAF